MLRAGSEERQGYSPGRLFSDLPPRSGYEMARRVGIAPTSAGFGGPCIACLPPPYVWEQPRRLHHTGKSAFYHPRAQRRPHHHTLSPESGHYLPPSVPLDGRSAPFEGRSADKERTPLPRAGWSCVSPSLASHPQVFHGGCFGVYGTPPREAVWFCEIGTKIPLVPRLGLGTLRIRWLSWLTFGWRVQTCSQVIAWYLNTAPPGVCLAAWPRCRLQSMPGFFRAVRGCGGQAADRFMRSESMGLRLDLETERGKRRSPAALEWASRASFGKLAFGG